jgi:hypothetical protein
MVSTLCIAAAAAVAAAAYAAAASTLVPEQGNFFQRQAMAVPEDMSDPLLKRWKKPDTNPFLVQASFFRTCLSKYWCLGRVVACLLSGVGFCL